jgi:methyl-accepting chemotaxis protein
MVPPLAPDSTGATALIIIAVAVSVQTLLLVAFAFGAMNAWRRMHEELDQRYRELVARMDQIAAPVRRAAEAMTEVSHRASDTLNRADHVATTVGRVLAVPRSLFAFGAATAASMVLSKWRRSRQGAFTK